MLRLAACTISKWQAPQALSRPEDLMGSQIERTLSLLYSAACRRSLGFYCAGSSSLPGNLAKRALFLTRNRDHCLWHPRDKKCRRYHRDSRYSRAPPQGSRAYSCCQFLCDMTYSQRFSPPLPQGDWERGASGIGSYTRSRHKLHQRKQRKPHGLIRQCRKRQPAEKQCLF